MDKGILENFAKASTYKSKTGFLSNPEREYEHEKEINSGIKNFKRRILGLRSSSTTKSIDEIATILTEMNIISKESHAYEFMEAWIDRERRSEEEMGTFGLDQAIWYGNYHRILVIPVQDDKGTRKYKIESSFDIPIMSLVD